MSETLTSTNYDDTETDFTGPEYAFDLGALKTHYSNEMGRQALSGIVKLEQE